MSVLSAGGQLSHSTTSQKLATRLEAGWLLASRANVGTHGVWLWNFVMSNKTRRILEQIYDNVHLALWSSLIAALIMFSAFVIPKIPAAQRNYQAARILKDAAERDFYCQKLGMIRGSANYHACIRDLEEYREKIQRRLVEEEIF